jgi:hypothetical protein
MEIAVSTTATVTAVCCGKLVIKIGNVLEACNFFVMQA